MKNKKLQLGRVLKRDSGTCGVHIGGCGRALPTRKSATRDHIIPESFISFMPADRKRDFNEDWNIQPMCPKCNNEVRGGQMADWPLFKCQCHYLQIGKSGGMYIHERTGVKERKHLLEERGTGDGTSGLFLAARLPGTGNNVGFSKEQKMRGGHILVPVPNTVVAPFNWFELARIGKARGRLRHEGENGQACIFLPDGRIVRDSHHPCATFFYVDIGHHNLRFDPFRPGDRKSDEYLHRLRSAGTD